MTWASGFSAIGIFDGVAVRAADPHAAGRLPELRRLRLPGARRRRRHRLLPAGRRASAAARLGGVYLPGSRSGAARAGRGRHAVQPQRGHRHLQGAAGAGHAGGDGLAVVGPLRPTPAPGELDLSAPDPATQYEDGADLDWFDHYLKGSAVSTGPAFAYFRDWVPTRASPRRPTRRRLLPGRRRAHATTCPGPASSTVAASRPRPARRRCHHRRPARRAPGHLDVARREAPGTLRKPDVNLPGTSASWTTAALGRPSTWSARRAHRPRRRADRGAHQAARRRPASSCCSSRCYDVAPDGTASLINGLVAPIRVADVTKPITVTLPAIVHRFAAGHSIGLVVAGGSDNYRGGVTPTPVTIASGAGQTLVLPAVG